MKLLVDMNLSPNWISVLRDSGWEAVHWSAVGQSDARDLVIMAYAASNDSVVMTHDLDFGPEAQRSTDSNRRSQPRHDRKTSGRSTASHGA